MGDSTPSLLRSRRTTRRGDSPGRSAVTHDHPSLDRWAPMTLDVAAALFEGAPFRWWIGGGRALELHLGRSWRSHGDTDVGIIRRDAGRIGAWLSGRELWVASRGGVHLWAGDDLSADRHENNVWVLNRARTAWCLDLTVGAGTADEWVYRRNETIRRRWPDAVLPGPGGVPYLAPDIQLLFKSLNRRPKDDRDAREVIPLLTARQQRFLDVHLPPSHPWRALLADRSD
jgi:hypothetical protein